MPGINFASLRIYREFHDIDPRLYEIFMDLVERFWPDPKIAARVVCVWRTDAENAADGAKTTIHCQPAPYRAVDIGAKEFTPVEIQAASDAVNSRWQYDPARPALLCCFTAPHGTGPHFHLQVHRSTRRK